MAKINIFAKSSLSILATSVLVVLTIGASQNNASLIQLGDDLFKTVLVGVVLVTAIRSDSKKSHK